MKECDYYYCRLCEAPAAVNYRMLADSVDTLRERLASEKMSKEAEATLRSQLKQTEELLSTWKSRLPNMAVAGAISSVTTVSCSLDEGTGECSGRPD